MIFKNSSRYDPRLVRYIVKFAANLIPLDNVAVNIKNTPHAYAGRAYSQTPGISQFYGKAKYLVVCRIGPPDKFPHQCKGYPGRKPGPDWPTPLLADWMEGLVYLVAHELMHVQQFRAKASCTEKETEAFGMRRLEAWREHVQAGKLPVFPEERDAVKPSKQATNRKKLAECQQGLTYCESRLKQLEANKKRVLTAMKKWQKKIRYYEKKLTEENNEVQPVQEAS